MKVYGQLHLAGCAAPYPDECDAYHSVAEAKRDLLREHNSLPDTAGQQSSLILFIGKPDPDWTAPCDGYPDYIFTTTPNGAVVGGRA